MDTKIDNNVNFTPNKSNKFAKLPKTLPVYITAYDIIIHSNKPTHYTKNKTPRTIDNIFLTHQTK